jgi:hypothetical protein
LVSYPEDGANTLAAIEACSTEAAQWTGAHKGPAFFAYADNYLIDVKFGVIVDVEASRGIRQAEVGAARTMIERTEERFGLKPERLAADTAYGAAPMLNWLVEEKGIAPQIPLFDKSKRDRAGQFLHQLLLDESRDGEKDGRSCGFGQRHTALYFRRNSRSAPNGNIRSAPSTPCWISWRARAS